MNTFAIRALWTVGVLGTIMVAGLILPEKDKSQADVVYDTRNACIGEAVARGHAEQRVYDSLAYPDEAKIVYSRDDHTWHDADNKCWLNFQGHVDAKTDGGFTRRVQWTVRYHVAERSDQRDSFTVQINQ